MIVKSLRPLFALYALLFALGACSKPDPILPGLRESVFPDTDLVVANKEIPNLDQRPIITNQQSDCVYKRDGANIVWDGTRKIFSGFATGNSVGDEYAATCAGGFVYAGLSTGELVKVNPRSRAIGWIADIYRASNMTGGAKLTDIVTPAVVSNGYVYVGGLGDAFCKLRDASGAKVWCYNIGVGVPFTIVGDYAFVVGTDNVMYAVNTKSGEIYWKTNVAEQSTPKYSDGVLTVGRERFSADTGTLVTNS